MTTALVHDLSNPDNLPCECDVVEHIETHASDVFLAGSEVFKTKKALDLGFLDFTTLAAREKDCQDELRLNRRTAPAIYLGVLPVRRDAAGYSLVRNGEIVDWAVHMQRLPDERSAASLLSNGSLSLAHVSAIASHIATFHREQPEQPPNPNALHANLEENFDQLAGFVPAILEPSVVSAVCEVQRSWFATHKSRLKQRTVRDGHGDLRLEHVYLMPEGPIAIDCIEFLDRFRITDPGLDAAFFAMELIREGQAELAEYFIARYAYEASDYAFYPLLAGYLSYLAVVRGKVACFVTAGEGCSAALRARKETSARQHLKLALDLLESFPEAPHLIAIGGVIAAGKTTLAVALSEALSAPIVSADSTRKDLAGLAHHKPGPPEIYTPEFSERTYTEIWERAGHVLASGRTVLVDTTFRRRGERDAFVELAHTWGARFTFVECTVDEATARARLRRRRATLSDAREDLWDSFVISYEPPIEISEDHKLVVDCSQPLAAVVEAVQLRLDTVQ